MIPADDSDRIVALARLGWATKQIAVEVGCSTRTVQRVRLSAGVSTPPPRPWTVEELLLAGELLADGASVAEVGRTFGRVNGGDLYRHFPGHAWSPRECGTWARFVARMSGTL